MTGQPQPAVMADGKRCAWSEEPVRITRRKHSSKAYPESLQLVGLEGAGEVSSPSLHLPVCGPRTDPVIATPSPFFD